MEEEGPVCLIFFAMHNYERSLEVQLVPVLLHGELLDTFDQVSSGRFEMFELQGIQWLLSPAKPLSL